MTSVGFQSIDTIEVLSKARVVSQEGAPLHLISFDFFVPLNNHQSIAFLFDFKNKYNNKE